MIDKDAVVVAASNLMLDFNRVPTDNNHYLYKSESWDV